MLPFRYQRVDTAEAAIDAFGMARAADVIQSPVQYLAGGTTLIDLMKIEVMRPDTLVDINSLADTRLGRIEADADALRLGAMVRMADAADHEAVRRDYPVIAQSLTLAASQQLRNMASLGGNVLQRTRCGYFRDVSYQQCNKRRPGSGCAALNGVNRAHAVLGASQHCIAVYPGDFAQALIALDAMVEVCGPVGARTLPFAALHRFPGHTPDVETTLAPGEIITAFIILAAPWYRRSLYLKIRDRESYEFALASAAVVLDLRDGVVREARIALGGVATVPWRALAAEALLRGEPLDEAILRQAARAAFIHAEPREHNAFKVELGERTLIRALKQAAAMELSP
jgi:xanthine dehydrogenase YagS FAD-binding subunit